MIFKKIKVFEFVEPEKLVFLMIKRVTLFAAIFFLLVAIVFSEKQFNSNREGPDGFRYIRSVFYREEKWDYSRALFVLILILALSYFTLSKNKDSNGPPMFPYKIPVFGSAIEFGKNPIELLKDARKKYGEIFRLHIIGKDITFLSSQEGHKAFFETPEEVLCARKAYSFTVPVFGPGVVYDCPAQDLILQRKIVSSGLTIKRFRSYIDLIREETEAYCDQYWKDSGEVDLLEQLNMLTILTSTRTLQGPEVRTRFTKEFADLYLDLDKALGPISFYFPHAPLPVHWKRDRARIIIGNLYQEIINRRRLEGSDANDMIQHMITSTYEKDQPIPDDHIIGMCVGLLLAGQHTSNVTSTWVGYEFLKNENVYKKVMDELDQIFPAGEKFDIDYEKYKRMNYFELVIRETLRLHPPIIMVIRQAEVEWKYKNYVVPKNSLVAVSPALSMSSEEFFENPEEFDPDRFNKDRAEDKKAYSHIAFSAGRHACIGEKFAYLQICVIWATLLHRYEISLVPDQNITPDYTTLIVSPKGPLKVKYSPRNK